MTEEKEDQGASTVGDDGTAARKAAYGTLSNMVVRLFSFGCTQVAFRLMKDDIAALGRASIQLELLLTTTLFMSREGFRLSLTRDLESDNWNVAWLSIPMSTVAATLAFIFHLHGSASEGDEDFRLGGILYCLAAWIEGLAEPAVLYSLRQMNVSLRVSAEGAATLCKTLATVVALNRWLPHWPIFAFGVAQLSYALVYSTFLYTKTWPKLTLPLQGGFDGRTCYMTLLFTIQGLFKHLLTEGDRIVLSTLSDGYNQGVYAMGTAYGGLAARFLLQPLEENARLLWSRLQSARNHNTQRIEQSYLVLVKLVLYVGFTFSCLATNYTSILLNVLAGSKWGSNEEAVAVLSAFCIYTAFLAWNGMTEAFIFGVATSGGEIGRMGLMHTVVGLFFAVIAPLFVSKFGTIGLVAANCAAMVLRSLYSVYFAATYFAKRNVEAQKDKSPTVFAVLWRLMTKMFPHWLVMLSFAASAAATNASLAWVNSQDVDRGTRGWYIFALRHVGLGGFCFAGILAVAFTLEKEFRSSIRSLLRTKED